MNRIRIINPVVYVNRNGDVIQPVGKNIFEKAGDFFKKNAKKALFGIVGGDKRAQPLLSVAASVVAGPVGGALFDVTMSAVDANEQKQKLKSAAKKAQAKDKAAIKQITDSFDKLKAESDKFRADRGLAPLNVTLPNLKKATPEMVEQAFAALQDDAAAIIAQETKADIQSTSGNVVDSNGVKTKTVLIVAGVAVAGIALVYFLSRRKRQ